jgi:hypothetical protein
VPAGVERSLEPEVRIELTTYRLRERTDVFLTTAFAPAVLLSVHPRVESFRFVRPHCFTIGSRMVLKILMKWDVGG